MYYILFCQGFNSFFLSNAARSRAKPPRRCPVRQRVEPRVARSKVRGPMARYRSTDAMTLASFLPSTILLCIAAFASLAVPRRPPSLPGPYVCEYSLLFAPSLGRHWQWPRLSSPARACRHPPSNSTFVCVRFSAAILSFFTNCESSLRSSLSSLDEIPLVHDSHPWVGITAAIGEKSCESVNPKNQS